MAMDLSVLTKMVQSNVRLILPTIGAFFVKDLESGFRAENVTFSTFLRYDDGRLTELLAQEEGIPAAEAMQRCEAIYKYVDSELETHGACGIPGLGTLRKLDDGQVVFVADGGQPASVPGDTSVAQSSGQSEGINVEKVQSPESGQKAESAKGKETVQSRAQRKQGSAAKRPAKPITQPKPASAKAKPALSGSGVNGFVKFVLVLLLLVAVAFTADFLWFGWVSPSLFPGTAPYLKMRTQHRLEAAANAVKAKEDQVESEELAANDGEESALRGEAQPKEDGALMEEFKSRSGESSATSGAVAAAGAPAPVERPAAQPSRKPSHVAPSSGSASAGEGATSAERAYGTPGESNSYHVVVGSFAEMENAKRFCSQLKAKGFSSEIIEQESGSNAVTVGSFTSLRAARQACSSMKDRFPDAWVLEY